MEAEKRTQVEISENRRLALDELLDADHYVLITVTGTSYSTRCSDSIVALGLLKVGEIEISKDFQGSDPE